MIVTKFTPGISGRAKEAGEFESAVMKSGVPGRIRTRDPLLRRQPLYPLSYWDSGEVGMVG